jgi:phospholipase C
MSVVRIRIAILIAYALTACSNSGAGTLPSSDDPLNAARFLEARPIQHVVIVVQEGRTLNNLFAGWPSAYAPMFGQTYPLHTLTRLRSIDYSEDKGMCELSGCMGLARGPDSRNDGFNLNFLCALGCSEPPRRGTLVNLLPYSYMNHREIAPYRTMASQYVLADNMFMTEWGGDFTAHQDLIAGSTYVAPNKGIIDVPNMRPWGCDAPKRTTVPLSHYGSGGVYQDGKMFPCITQYPTMADTLDRARLSWKYYVEPVAGSDASGKLWNAFDAIKKVRYGPDWKDHIVSPPSRVLEDAEDGQLPALSWVIPKLAWSDHPATSSDEGPSWVAAIVNAIGKGPEWKSTAIIVVWSDWGGWFDASVPSSTYLGGYGYGFRVPCLIVSPYAKSNVTSHTLYNFGSILRFVEETFSLPSLSSQGYGFAFSDSTSNSLSDAFDFEQRPRAFRRIPAKYPASFFTH